MVSWLRLRYRAKQVVRILQAPFIPVDRAYVQRHLVPCDTHETPAAPPSQAVEAHKLVALFNAMPRAEQLHGIEVCQALEARGYQDLNLLAAALLHDVGKTLLAPRLWERIWVVLIEHAMPRLAARLGAGMPRGLRRGFVVRRRHASWGAELAAEAGASARTVALIRLHHSDAGEDAELAALQIADEA